jgi:ssDNA-binding Zn-finger/Zn-ribbon topoisomerase 1
LRLDSDERFNDILQKVAKRYNIDIEHSYAVKIEALQEKIREKAIKYIKSNGLQVTLDNTISILEKILLELGLIDEKESIRKLLESYEINDRSYVDLLVGQAVLQALSSIIAEKEGYVENKTAVCPVCGTETDQGFISSDGTIWLHCPVCGYMWKQSSILHPVCPYCGLDDKKMIGILKDKTNPSVVVMLCSNCKRYWILVDEKYTKRVPRNLYPIFRSKAEKIIKSIPKEFLEY